MQEPFHMVLPMLHHIVTLGNGNCYLIMPVVKGRCSYDALPHIFDIDTFKCGKNNSITKKHVYNESMSLIDTCDVAFDNNDWWNIP